MRALQSSGGWQYGDALILAQREQVPVAGDDELSFGGERTGEHVIIIGIGEDGGHDRGGMYDGDEAQVALHELRWGEAGGGDGPRKPGISQDLLELGQQDWAGEESEREGAGASGELMRWPLPQQRGNCGVGVQDEAQLALVGLSA